MRWLNVQKFHFCFLKLCVYFVCFHLFACEKYDVNSKLINEQRSPSVSLTPLLQSPSSNSSSSSSSSSSDDDDDDDIKIFCPFPPPLRNVSYKEKGKR